MQLKEFLCVSVIVIIMAIVLNRSILDVNGDENVIEEILKKERNKENERNKN